MDDNKLDLEWFSEDRVQEQVLDYMQNEEGFVILSSAQADAGAGQGSEIVAERESAGLTVHRLVTVRGWPQQAYTRSTSSGQLRPARPEIIANGWIAQSVFDLALSRGADRDVELAFAVPAMAGYIRYLQRLRWFLSTARVPVYLVSQEGRVSVVPPGAAPVSTPSRLDAGASGENPTKRRKLGLPGASRLQLPLLHALVMSGGTASRSESIDAVSHWFPEVAQPPSVDFGQRVSVAQSNLQEEGLAELAGRGLWHITEAGRALHDAQWPGWLQKEDQ